MKVKVEGLKALDAALGELAANTSVRTAKAAMTRILKAAAQPIDQDWRARAPQFEGFLRTGGGVGSNLTARQRKLHKKESEVEVHVGAGADPAAHIQEFGASDQAAQPFMRPAWEANKDRALDIVAKDLGAEIMKTAARAARRGKRKG